MAAVRLQGLPWASRRIVRLRFHALVVLTLGAVLTMFSLSPLDAASDVGGLADPARQRNVHLIRVSLPIVGAVDRRVMKQIDAALEQVPEAGDRPVVILEFWPPANDAGSGSQFGRSWELARYLSSARLRRSRTIAYVPRSIDGHAIMVAMACEEIIMHPNARLGRAESEQSQIDPTIRRAYTDLADRFRTLPAAVALGLIDPSVTVYRVELAGGTQYVLPDQLQELKQKQAVKLVETVISAGELGQFSGRQLRLKHGFVSRLVGSLEELAASLELPRHALAHDPLLGGQLKSVQIQLKGPITAQQVDEVQRALETALKSGANFVCLWIDSPGGSPQDSVRLANTLAALDRGEIRTVAYVPHQALSDAALVATACDDVIVRDDSLLGGDGPYQMNDDELADLHDTIRDSIAPSKSRSWSLIAAMFSPDLEVYHYRLSGGNVVEYFCEEERQAQADPDRWERGQEETHPGTTYRIKGSRAEKVHLARDTVENFVEFKELYHLEDDPTLVEPKWVDDLIRMLASPELAGVLMFIGGLALLSELMSPGIGLGGFIASVCYLLFFWSQFLNGTATWLEVLLFLTGVTFVALEIFIIPGFGIFGLGGGALIIVSLVLASQTILQFPKNDYQLTELRNSLLTVGAAVAGVGSTVFLLQKYFDQVPLLWQMMLSPVDGEQLDNLQERESLVDYCYLLGKQGYTTTQLVPAGKVRFGDEVIDVLSDGEMIQRNTNVYVDEVHGNRVIVRRMD